MVRIFPKYTAPAFKISFLFCLVLTLTAAGSFPFLQPLVPMFYSLSQPEKQLVHKAWIFLFPVLGWIVFFTHTTLLSLFHEVEGNIQKIFSWVTAGTVILLTILLIRVIMIVT